VAGVGPQLNYFFPVTDKIQDVVTVKAYWEFAAQNRPDGWNAWLTIASSPAPSKKPEEAWITIWKTVGSLDGKFFRGSAD
jgi:hypothetical protein